MQSAPCKAPAFRRECLNHPRHQHDYTPRGDAVRRCHCGSRGWRITAGGQLPPLVSCRNCGGQNRTATAYERGRADAAAS